MSASPKMLPENVSHHQRSNHYNAPFHHTGAPGLTPSYSNSDIEFNPQVWPNVSSTYKQPHTPLPEISEFLREENLKTVQTLPQPRTDSVSKSWERKSHFSNTEDYVAQQNNRFAENALNSTDEVQFKRSHRDSVPLPEPHASPPKKRICTEDKVEKIPKFQDHELIPCAPTFSQLLSVDATKIQTIDNCEYMTPNKKSQFEYMRDSCQISTHLSDNDSKDHHNNNNNGNNQHNLPQLPYFTSLMLNDNLALSSYNQSTFFSDETYCTQQPFSNCETLDSADHATINPMIYINGKTDAEPPIIDPLQTKCDIKQECRTKGLKALKKRDVPKSKGYNILTRNSPPSSYVKLERMEQSKNLPFFSHPDPNNLRELSWEDAKKHTQQSEYGFLPLQSSNTLLEDIDLSEVDNACMEQFERECQKEALQEMDYACKMLHIPTDANTWTEHQVDQWIMWTIRQCNLPLFDTAPLRMPGVALCTLGEAEMLSRVPTCGDIIHARLRIWKTAAKMFDSQRKANNTHFAGSKSHSVRTSSYSSDDTIKSPKSSQEETGRQTPAMKPAHASSIHLWMFLKELLLQPQHYGRFIRWIDKEKGVFKIEDSVEVARLWGVRKNRPAMNYDKLSRSIRQYYKKGIIKKTTVSQRLVYQFVNPTLEMPI